MVMTKLNFKTKGKLPSSRERRKVKKWISYNRAQLIRKTTKNPSGPIVLIPQNAERT